MFKILLVFQVEENLGMAMVFALVSALQEYLNERLDERKKEIAKKQEQIEEEKRKKQEEEVSEAYFCNTVISVEAVMSQSQSLEVPVPMSLENEFSLKWQIWSLFLPKHHPW